MTVTVNTTAQWAGRRQVLAIPVGGNDGNRFLLSLSGTVFVNFSGQAGGGWHRDKLLVTLDLNDAIAATGRRPSSGMSLSFRLQQWTSIVTPNAFGDLANAVNLGIAIDDFDIDWRNGQAATDFILTASIAARDVDAEMFRVGLLVQLLGDLVEVKNPPLG